MAQLMWTVSKTCSSDPYNKTRSGFEVSGLMCCKMTSRKLYMAAGQYLSSSREQVPRHISGRWFRWLSASAGLRGCPLALITPVITPGQLHMFKPKSKECSTSSSTPGMRLSRAAPAQ
ncbi:MAG: hypothetical protein FRX49_11739 [Trebouxia sp. A1-2]|nr:MAG: hypothetical protein FRX49_11739 [Trebouxia sp. A1-2]